MKIIHVSGFLGIGGLEKIIFHLALEQTRRGHSVEIYVYDFDRAWVDFFKKNGLNVITPKIKDKGYDLKVLKRMNKDLFVADIIHTHDLNPLMYIGPIYLLRKLFLRNNPKIIHTTHGLTHIDHYPNGKLYEFFFSRLADKITCVSEKIGRFYIDEIKLKSNKITVIQNGIGLFTGEINKKLKNEAKVWLASRHNLDSNRPIVLSLSRIIPLKDQKFLIQALKERPHYQLIVVGPPSDQDYFNELKKLEDPNIILVGPQELVLKYNMGADLYISSSTLEGIPVAVLEAMSVETPCLISNIPGHMTLLKYGPWAETYTLGDAKEFLTKFDMIFADKEKTSLNAKNARLLVEDYYSVVKMVDQYINIYEC